MARKIVITETQLRSLLKEAVMTSHSMQRMKQRIEHLGFSKKDRAKIERAFNKVRQTDYYPWVSYAIRIFRFKPKKENPNYTEIEGTPYYMLRSGKKIDSIGDEFWVVVRENQIRTFLLRKSSESTSVSNIQRLLTVDEVQF